MRYKGKLTRRADLLTRHPIKGTAVPGVSAFMLDIRGEVVPRPGARIKEGVSIRGDSLFFDMQKEVMND